MARVLTVNVGRLTPIRSEKHLPTGIDKHPVDGPVEVRAPGAKRGGLGSGLVGDAIGDVRHHGGDVQAVYAYAREELDDFAEVLGRPLDNGAFGENLTTSGLVVSDALIGERWQVGPEVILQVSAPRIPCGTFRAHIGQQGWLKTFTRAARSGAYLRVVTPGSLQAGDEVTVVHRPDHGVRVSDVFRGLTLEPELLPGLLVAGDDLEDETRDAAERRRDHLLG
ncbi:MAG: MOSC domain-containing protein [Lapillicoccus sp.]